MSDATKRYLIAFCYGVVGMLVGFASIAAVCALAMLLGNAAAHALIDTPRKVSLVALILPFVAGFMGFKAGWKLGLDRE